MDAIQATYEQLTGFQSTRPVRAATLTWSKSTILERFQSTRPVRAATWTDIDCIILLPHFNPRGPCGPRRLVRPRGVPHRSISIHAARAGRDSKLPRPPSGFHKFQSTRPVRAATDQGRQQQPGRDISIHAARAGRDATCSSGPRFFVARFQSTRPVRAATPGVDLVAEDGGISIHAARAGRDAPGPWAPPGGSGFQSTRPVRAATAPDAVVALEKEISIHAARAGRDGGRP